MIKTAQDAYLAGRQAAMEKISKEERWGIKNRDGSVTYTKGKYLPTGAYSVDDSGMRIYDSIFDDGGPRGGLAGAGLESILSWALDPLYYRAAAAQKALPTSAPAAQKALPTSAPAAQESPPKSRLSKFLGLQADIAGNVGIGTQGLIAAADPGQGAYNPMRLATMENLARLGILGGAAGGTYLGGSNPRAAAVSSAGALGGAQLGGNLGAGINAALSAYGINGGLGYDDRTMQSALGSIGALSGGLAAGKYLS